MKITVAGAGYVGLSIALLLARQNEVKIIDIIPEKINKINRHISPIDDEYIQEFFDSNNLNLVATLDEEAAYQDADFVIIAVPTKFNDDNASVDTTKVEKVIEDILDFNPNATIVIKSTVPVGYTKRIKEKYHIDKILFSPEFLRKSKALFDSLNPSRIIVGCDEYNKPNANAFGLLLRDCSNNKEVPILLMNYTEAEVVKLFASAFLALRVSYFNELDTYAEMNNLNRDDIIKGVSLDPRVGDNYNHPSFGYGGECFTQDVKMLNGLFDNIPSCTIKSPIISNDKRTDYVVSVILNKLDRICEKNKSNNIYKKLTVGFFNRNSSNNTDGLLYSPIYDILKKIKYINDKELKNNYSIIVYGKNISEIDNLNNNIIENDINKFKELSDIIVTNKWDNLLDDVKDKVYCRD